MEKFTDLENKKDVAPLTNEIKYDGYLKVISNGEWEWVQEGDCVIFLPYLVMHNCILLRMEPIPPYKERFADINKFVTVGSGTVDEGEKPIDTLKRELLEEFGLQIRDTYEFEIEKPVMVNKGNSSQYHICIIPLYEYDYRFTTASGDGSEGEMNSSNFRVNVNELNNIDIYDLVTQYTLMKFRTKYHY